jgi:hypothetical protein
MRAGIYFDVRCLLPADERLLQDVFAIHASAFLEIENSSAMLVKQFGRSEPPDFRRERAS